MKEKTGTNKEATSLVMFVDTTPGGESMTTFEVIVRGIELPIQIVERSGDSIKVMVVKSN